MIKLIFIIVTLIVFALILILCPRPAHSASSMSSCGSERWAIKTGADSPLAGLSAVSILSFVPTPVSVLAMRLWPAPVRPSAISRISPHETILYRVTADLIAYKVEKDEDVHLVIAEPSNHALTMIAEIPNPDDCMIASPSILVSLVRSVRSTFLSRYPLYSLGKLHTLPSPVRITITGIGFFDKLHGQSGLAPNGIELHPVTAIRFNDK